MSSSIQRGFLKVTRGSSLIQDHLVKKRGERGGAEGGGDRVNGDGDTRHVHMYTVDEWEQ